MFCPNCKDEFRSGFTRCADCGVDLVADLSAAAPQSGHAAETASQPGTPAAVGPTTLRMVDVCGFFSLDDAREARARLQLERLHADVLIRESEPTDDGGRSEEFWLRVEASGIRTAAGIFAQEEDADAPGGDGRTCGQCGAELAPEAATCSSCGARLEGP